MILDIIHFNSLSLHFQKVIKSPLGDTHNGFVNSIACSSYDYISLPISFSYSNISTISYFPLWKNIIIEYNLRKFITNVSYDIGLKNFLHLHRNSCNMNMDVD